MVKVFLTRDTGHSLISGIKMQKQSPSMAVFSNTQRYQKLFIYIKGWTNAVHVVP